MPSLLTVKKKQKSVFNSGFTVIELLVVISIIGLLSSVIFASVNSAREKARLAAGLRFYSSYHHAAGAYAVGQWSFEDGAGSNATDSSGENHDGTLIGNPSWQTEAQCDFRLGGCLYLDGIDDYVLIDGGDNSTLNPGLGDFSAFVWVRPSDTSDIRGVLSKVGSGGYRIRITNGWLEAGYYDGSWHSVASTEKLPLDVWSHVGFVLNRGGAFSIFIDGRRVGSFDASPQAGSDIQPSGFLNIGFDSWSNFPKYFHGYIDEVRVYNESFVASEVERMYALQRQRRKLSGL
jgi:prepilin-type N-terminal cleavage/methylation domain-containing protein